VRYSQEGKTLKSPPIGLFSKFSRRALFPLSRLLSAQQAPKDTTFKSDVKVVNLFATVRDKKDQFVRNLNKEDFLLDEDGQQQTITYFSRETNLPLTIGLLVDTSGSTRSVLPDERSASDRFLRQVLREDRDLAFLIHFDFEVELLQDLTSSRDKLERALDLLETGRGQRQLSNCGQRPSGYPGGRGQGRQAAGTIMYDAVLLASDELMKKQTGRKALILLSDGVDTGSKVTLFEAIKSAQRADTLVYSILFEERHDGYGLFTPGMGGRRGGMGRRGQGPQGRGGGARGKAVLEQISRETGGRFFEVSQKQPIDKSSPPLRRICAINTAWAIHPTSRRPRVHTGGFTLLHVRRA